MPTKIIELRQPTGPDRREDPDCRACGRPTPRGHISASDLWCWAKRQPPPVYVFKTPGDDGPEAA